ncbi:MAG TPA: protein kinase [Burkholderiaceae bacterium]|jgi:serine/threonine protein kinase/Tfp pilus assembly protein PilF|nr:protein kinase [Burkholderiaceae bacterium]
MGLKADQIALLSRLLDQALPLTTEGRRHWLENVSPEHQALLPALRQALLSDDDATSTSRFFGTLPGIGPGAEAPTVSTSGLQAGQRIGPYQLVRELGLGGMAVVWLAQRADGAFRREVALKLPLLSHLRRDLAERFARERDILAQLEHPNIARLYDAGLAANGLPYLAMEYVEGQPLTTWCDAQRYSLRERLKLFLQVLDAVQYAHGCQVVHRDLKPSNILVTQSGQVRLLDFGVAKLLADGAEADRTDLTRVYGRVLTPDYSSPEQLMSEPVGPASDIYALGVVLYELLVGNRPYHIKSEPSSLPLELAIRAAHVRKPSAQVHASAAAARSSNQESLMRALRGDLDAIVLKAAAREPQDRYPSASAFADDLQRYLSGDPVEARPNLLTYRIGKLVLRHRPAAAAIAASIAAAIALMVIGGKAWLSDSRPRADGLGSTMAAAVRASDKSIAVLPFVDLSEAHNQEYFSDGLSEELIDRLARTGDLRVIARTSSFQFKGRNEDVRAIARRLGVASVLEGSVRKAGSTIRVTAQLIKGSDGSHLWSQTYERDLTDVFRVQDDICSTVVNALQATLSGDPPPNRASERNLEAYNAFLQGWYFYQRATQEDLKKSVAAYREAVRLDPQYARAWAELARAYVRQGNWQWDTVENAYRNARDAIEHALAIDPDQPLAHRMLGYVYWDYDLNREAGQAEFKKARELDPSDADALSALTVVALAFGRIDEAIEMKRRNVEADPLNALMLDDLASLYLDAGRPADAERALRRALALDPSYTGGHCNLGQLLLARGQPELALEEMQKESDQVARAGCLPFAYWALGRLAEADAALKALIDKYADLNSYGIAQVFAYEGKTETAFEWLERARRQRELGLTMVKVDYLFRGLQADPRFGALLAQMKLPQ